MTDEQCYKILLAEQSRQIEELKGQVEAYKADLLQVKVKDMTSTIDDVVFDGYVGAYEDFKAGITYQRDKHNLVVDHIVLKMSAYGDNLEYFCNKLGIERGTHTFTNENGKTEVRPNWRKDILSELLDKSVLLNADNFINEILKALKHFSIYKIEKIKFIYMDCMGCECNVQFEGCDYEAQLTLYAYNKDESDYAIGLDYF